MPGNSSRMQQLIAESELTRAQLSEWRRLKVSVPRPALCSLCWLDVSLRPRSWARRIARQSGCRIHVFRAAKPAPVLRSVQMRQVIHLQNILIVASPSGEPPLFAKSSTALTSSYVCGNYPHHLGCGAIARRRRLLLRQTTLTSSLSAPSLVSTERMWLLKRLRSR